MEPAWLTSTTGTRADVSPSHRATKIASASKAKLSVCYTLDATATIKGTAEAGATVTALFNGISNGTTTVDNWIRVGVITFIRAVNGVSSGDFEIAGAFGSFGFQRLRLNDPNVLASIRNVRLVPVSPVAGYATTGHLESQLLPLSPGNHTLTLVAAGSGIVDEVGNAFTTNNSVVIAVPPAGAT